MEALTDFLANNYFWFLIVSLFLVFALVGYLVDQNEQKKGMSRINHIEEPEMDMESLAAMAQNKSMNEAVTDAARNVNNTITDMNNPNSANAVGFDVLTK